MCKAIKALQRVTNLLVDRDLYRLISNLPARKQMSIEVKQKTIELLRSGLSNREVARRVGFSPVTVAKVRVEANLPPSTAKRPMITKEQETAILGLVSKNYSLRKIARIVGVAHTTVVNVMVRRLRTGDEESK